ncbi:MAG: hypothetical protein IT232_00790 [Flavobacteriales bacterium]|nr:hypothetical protein [Flavobacteriales bacterium]
MKQLIILTLTIFLITSCKSGKNSNSTLNKQEIQLKKNQFLGTVKFSTPVNSSREASQHSKKEYYIEINNEYYFVKFSEGFVKENTLSKYIDKEIIIKGEIKNGKWEDGTSGSIANKTIAVQPRIGKYVTIDKIIK